MGWGVGGQIQGGGGGVRVLGGECRQGRGAVV